MSKDGFWTWIIIKGNDYLQCAVVGVPVWSIYRSDAAPINILAAAMKIAEKVGGRIIRYNTATGETK